jgi:hypothetical protein
MPPIGTPSPFSQSNRVRLIDEYFGDLKVDPATAWQDVYRLLMWVDTRTGVAHCYESDKSQPGKPWYPRSLVFHDWVSDQLGVAPVDLKDHVDYMFRRVIGAVTQAEADVMVQQALRIQRELFPAERSMPAPGDDPRLQAIVEPLMARDPAKRPSPAAVTDALRKIYVHMRSENKRANLLGRGFEDVIDGVLSRLPVSPEAHDTQTPLEKIPGFRKARAGDKTEKVDLWVGDGGTRRVLVSAKWSIRADREKQLATDFATYVQANELRDPFEHVWITNEFDPARLVSNATNTAMNRHLFDAVVHICPEALWVVHNLGDPKGPNPTRLRELLDERRVIGLETWLQGLVD